MAEKLITKSFERLLDKGKHRGFITYEELGKSLGKRNSTHENLEKALMLSLSRMRRPCTVADCRAASLDIYIYIYIYIPIWPTKVR